MSYKNSKNHRQTRAGRVQCAHRLIIADSFLDNEKTCSGFCFEGATTPRKKGSQTFAQMLVAALLWTEETTKKLSSEKKVTVSREKKVMV
jgi:hypothetical protein